MEDWFAVEVSPAAAKREREKARALRATDWWKARLAKGVCHYCGRKFPPGALTMDHVVPVARGGKSVKSNCVPCCKECNNSKKMKTPVEDILDRLLNPA